MITVHIEHQIRSISITLDFEIDTQARYEHASETATINKNTTVERHSHTIKKKRMPHLVHILLVLRALNEEDKWLGERRKRKAFCNKWRV